MSLRGFLGSCGSMIGELKSNWTQGVVPTVTETIEVSEGILSTLKANLGFAATESKEPGMAKEIWSEFLKDSFGAAEQAKAKAQA